MRTVVFLGALAACGGGESMPDAFVPSDAPPRQVVMENLPLVVGEIVEAKLVGGAGDYARIRLVNPTPTMDWNIHGHANGGTQVVQEQLQVMSADYLFAPTAQAEWYLLIRNRGQTDTTVQVNIELYADLTWSGWI